MPNQTQQFTSRLRKSNNRLEEDLQARLDDILERDNHKDDTPVNESPAWIDTSDVEAHTDEKGAIIDVITGRTEFKSYSQRG